MVESYIIKYFKDQLIYQPVNKSFIPSNNVNVPNRSITAITLNYIIFYLFVNPYWWPEQVKVVCYELDF
jgi:hypothetical protein